MPDITMCESQECPKAKRCYRHEVTPSMYHQSWTNFYDPAEARCAWFVPIAVEEYSQGDHSK